MPESSDIPGEPRLDEPAPSDVSADLHTTATVIDTTSPEPDESAVVDLAPAEPDESVVAPTVVDGAEFAAPVASGFAPAPGIGEPFVAGPPPAFGGPAPIVRKGLAVAALVTGIVAFVLGWLPVVGAAIGIAAVVLGIVALVRRQTKALSITGLALGAAAVVVSIVVTVVALGLVAASFAEAAEEAAQESAAPVDEGSDEGSDEVEEVPVEDYAALDDASFAAILDDPVAAFGAAHVVYGEVQQFDEMTGPCSALIAIDNAQQARWEEYTVISWAFGSGETECPELDGLAEMAHVKLWVTVLGSITTEFDDGTVEDVLSLNVTKFEELAPLP